MKLVQGLLLWMLLASAACPQSVSGQVLDTLGVGVPGVALCFSGGVAPLGAVTDLLGFFSVAVPAGNYDIVFQPPGSTLVPARLKNVTVTGPTPLGVITLQAGFLLSGTIIDVTGAPLFAVDINVYDQATGVKLFTPNDNTNLLGVFNVVVPPGLYRVRGTPTQPLPLLVAEEIRDVSVTAPTNLAPIVLPPGFPLTGSVVDSQTLAPLQGINLNVNDAVTGQRIITPGDLTSISGAFSVVVPPGTFRVSFNPPVGVLYVGLRVENVVVAGATSMGVVTLDPGLALSGSAVDANGNPVSGVDIDVRLNPGGTKLFTPHDITDAAGAFTVVVPVGNYAVIFEPPFASGLVGERVAPVTVNANLTLPPTTLPTGQVLSGTVSAWNGGPEVDADLDVVDPQTGQQVVTPLDQTDALGHYQLLVPPGSWTVIVRPGKLSFSQDKTIPGVVVAGATTLNIQLALVPITAYLDRSSAGSVSPFGLIFLNLAFFNFAPQPVNANLSLVMIDPLGVESIMLPPIPLAVPGLQPFLFFGVPFVVPPANPALLGLPHRFEFRITDPITGLILDQDHIDLVVQ